jgi:hypothetical protein
VADWNPLYGDVKTYTGLSAADYKAVIGHDPNAPLPQAASSWGGTLAAPFMLSVEEFKQVLGAGARARIDRNPGSEDKIAAYLSSLGEAFRIAGVDTVESQALFLAHGAGETGFAAFTEGQTNEFTDDPGSVVVDAVSAAGPLRYSGWSKIDPNGVIQAGMDPSAFAQTFIGRGPIQVTFGYGYIQTLVYMDRMADDRDGDEKDRLLAVMSAIRGDPAEAARATQTFLFSASYMHMSGMIRRSPSGFSTAGMSGGADDPRIAIKQAAYSNAIRLLQEKATAYRIATEN